MCRWRVLKVSAPGANPGATDSTGKKKLVFPDRQVGDSLELAIYRKDYELVNDLDRLVTLPRDPFCGAQFLLCRPERCFEERFSFFRLSAEPLKKKIEAGYQAKLEELEERWAKSMRRS